MGRSWAQREELARCVNQLGGNTLKTTRVETALERTQRLAVAANQPLIISIGYTLCSIRAEICSLEGFQRRV